MTAACCPPLALPVLILPSPQWKEGKSTKYIDRVREQVARGRVLAQELGIDVPLTVEEYCIKHEAPAEARFAISPVHCQILLSFAYPPPPHSQQHGLAS